MTVSLIVDKAVLNVFNPFNIVYDAPSMNKFHPEGLDANIVNAGVVLLTGWWNVANALHAYPPAL
jgi:hypothetical protein